MGVHDGHRSRMRQRYLNGGLDQFAEHEILELLLFNVIARRDTNEVAHRLLERFGSLAKVFDAPISALQEVDGMGDAAATLIKLIPDIYRSYRISGVQDSDACISDAQRLLDATNHLFIGKPFELCYAVLLDSSLRVIRIEELGQGYDQAVEIDFRRMVDAVSKAQAHSVALCHNDPNSNPYPSREDVDVTKTARQILDAIRVSLMDHLVIANGTAISMRQEGLLET